MASRIEHRAEYAQGVAEVFAAETSEEALTARLAEIGGKNSALLSHSADADGARYTLRQGIEAEKLPQIVRKLQPGDLYVDREHTFTRGGDGYTGTAKATVSGMPGEITARTEIRPAGEGTVVETRGEVKVKIPLVGGKLESFVAGELTKLLAREAQFSAEWLARTS
ncbi:DUF2505 domain-containing protein [Amycolatopsis endophytica]|uniref:DUF2505 domain-containing protein n=1 Tax=Amycolatopsis endophytica TaxID=860233 RepID=A0A853AZJ3_9PSEU|nr:DUF2505 domain-containing protein [Amycolatopsis endophytica]NYI88037.1 hypothetical protein [Amycolatopsis endophytica]